MTGMSRTGGLAMDSALREAADRLATAAATREACEPIESPSGPGSADEPSAP